MSGMWIPLFTVAMSAEMGRHPFVEEGLGASGGAAGRSAILDVSRQGSADCTAILNLSQPIREQGFLHRALV